MGSRLDPAFGGLGVGAPGRYLSGGSFFRISRVAAFFHWKCSVWFFSSRIVLNKYPNTDRFYNGFGVYRVKTRRVAHGSVEVKKNKIAARL